MKRIGLLMAVAFLLGALLGGGPSTAGARGAPSAQDAGAVAQNGLLRVSVINPDRATLHIALDPRIPPNAVMIYHGSNVVIYNATNVIVTPGPIVTLTPTRYATPPAGTLTPSPAPTETPIAMWRATVRKFPRLLVMSRPGGGGTQAGAVGYGTVLEIVEERNWWGRIEQPVAGWIDLTWCEVAHE